MEENTSFKPLIEKLDLSLLGGPFFIPDKLSKSSLDEITKQIYDVKNKLLDNYNILFRYGGVWSLHPRYAISQQVLDMNQLLTDSRINVYGDLRAVLFIGEGVFRGELSQRFEDNSGFDSLYDYLYSCNVNHWRMFVGSSISFETPNRLRSLLNRPVKGEVSWMWRKVPRVAGDHHIEEDYLTP